MAKAEESGPLDPPGYVGARWGCSACDIGGAQYLAADTAIRRASVASLDSTEIWSERESGRAPTDGVSMTSYMTSVIWNWQLGSRDYSLSPGLLFSAIDRFRKSFSATAPPSYLSLACATLRNQDSTRLTATAIGSIWTLLVLLTADLYLAIGR